MEPDASVGRWRYLNSRNIPISSDWSGDLKSASGTLVCLEKYCGKSSQKQADTRTLQQGARSIKLTTRRVAHMKSP